MDAVIAPRNTAPCDSAVRRMSQPLPTPRELRERLPLSPVLDADIAAHRRAIQAILQGEDDRLLVVTGPCSVHDPQAALEYAERLAALNERVGDRLLLVMRVYVEKPRTTVGWKGLAYDPYLDGSDDMAAGLAMGRRLMRDIATLGLPIATELLQPTAAAYFDDLLSWAAIGARTTESQIHREMASGLHAAVGFKNGTQGNIDVAIAAMQSAAHSHRHFGTSLDGAPAMIETAGNPHTHLVLRGGQQGPNHDRDSVVASRLAMAQAGLDASIMVDCSHANSRKDHRRQVEVLHDVLAQRLAGERGLIGVMLESHLFEGKQPLGDNLRYGVSVTDACLGWETTEQALVTMAERLRLPAV
ncbi:3-deoxy-7-phosphoheptulonate synthase [Salinicola rhizosphaerae]|uniref:Phospho-2-dehydro-3-deoxyheptonate aldolase n=1 Tax=Salinicola rhizosphaerae TaxID=1443141 RepID=A0ABQ3DY88_9GAMM|nr:3-deoxy-7-phosphoheptulonate synthase [Salinicola rhizosphaerae]GHB20275.1 phospho-2-dehydro-3-deoxyheptonate aldolase [Salinicola rhizosphaerae]